MASAGSIFWSALLQVITVPVLLNSWGAESYGIWLMLSAMPSYIALSDLGLGSAATSCMAMAYAKGDFSGVSKTFQSILKLTIIISIVVFVLAILALSIALLFEWSADFIDKNGVVIVLLAMYSGSAMVSRVFLAAFRSCNKYAFGTIVYDAIQFVEGGAVLIFAMLGYGFLWAATGLLLGRLILLCVMCFQAKLRIPELTIGLSLSSKNELLRLLPPALGAFSIPASLAINMQGMVLVSGTLLSPVAAAILSPTRTISRIAIQLVGIVNRATVPEFSAAYARKDREALEKIIKINLTVIFLVLLPGALAFALFGGWAVQVWSVGKINPTGVFVGLIALSMFIHGCWYFVSNLLLAINLHQKLASTLLMSSVVSVVTAIILGNFLGIEGVAVAVVISELIALVKVIHLVIEIKSDFFNFSKSES